jgi:L-ornithine N5-monooxygenase
MKIYDFVGVGFGPANLSVAVAMDDAGMLNKDGLQIKFIESKSEFGWHPGMLLPEADMQISFFKDLATLRNPTSKYTFLNYLFSSDRLEDFANLRNFFPSRLEYNDYLKWAANHFNDYVLYGHKVVSINPIYDGHLIDHLEICIEDNNKIISKLYAKNISLATGITKNIPEGIFLDEKNKKIMHSNDFLNNLEHEFNDKNSDYKFLVIGSGQSAAEITNHLSDHYPNANIELCLRNYSLRPADETEFSNEIFSSHSAKNFFAYDEKLKEKVLLDFKNTNYSVVDPALIKQLYNKMYSQKVTKIQKIKINQFYELKSIDVKDNIAVFYSLQEKSIKKLNFDGIFLATGYESKITESLSNLEQFFIKDNNGRLEVTNNYLVKTNSSDFKPKIFIQGASEHSHGLSEILLSLISYRAEKIINTLSETIG